MIARSSLLLCTTTVSFVFRRWTGGLGKRFFTRPSSTLGQGKYSTCTCKLSVGHRGASSWTGKHAVSGETLARTAVVLKREREREHESTGGAAFDDLLRLISPVGTVSC